MTAPTPSGEAPDLREAVARTELHDRIVSAFGQAAWSGESGISVHGGKIAMNHDGWKAIGPLLDEALAPLRAENESLRAERAAAIARAEEAERKGEKAGERLASLGSHVLQTMRNVPHDVLDLQISEEAHFRDAQLFRSERDAALSEASSLRAELAQAKAQVAGMRERAAATAEGHQRCMEGNPPTSGECVARWIAEDIRALTEEGSHAQG